MKMRESIPSVSGHPSFLVVELCQGHITKRRCFGADLWAHHCLRGIEMTQQVYFTEMLPPL